MGQDYFLLCHPESALRCLRTIIRLTRNAGPASPLIWFIPFRFALTSPFTIRLNTVLSPSTVLFETGSQSYLLSIKGLRLILRKYNSTSFFICQEPFSTAKFNMRLRRHLSVKVRLSPPKDAQRVGHLV